jgi:serine/threonine-protein kinase
MADPNPPKPRQTEYRPSEATEANAPPAAPRALPFGRGDVIADRYELVRKLGEGGMGVVWVAHAKTLGVDVAIKLIRSDAAADGEHASRMAREAQATATLAHPAVVRVFDHGTTSLGDPFLVMELVDGETLGALLQREQKLEVTSAIQLMLPLLDGLRCAHERGIIHRDIKPENVLLARDPFGRVQPKLLDFGIAKLEHQPAVNRLTQVGDVLGSPEFMSPEQAKGTDVDQRTDVWSVCVVLYEMLTGELPFQNKNYNALMQAILNRDPTPTTDFGVGDRELWRIVAKGLAKARERRWQSMTELGEALAFWLYGRGVAEDLCGNSLKALWLGGTLTGHSLRPRNDSAADIPSPVEAERQQRAVQTLKLRLRRVRHVARLLFTRPVKIALAVVALLGLVSVALGLATGKNDARPGVSAAASAVAEEPSAKPSASPVAADSGTVSFESLPVEPRPSAGAAKKPGRVQRAPSPAPRPKPKRDYGL